MLEQSPWPTSYQVTASVIRTPTCETMYAHNSTSVKRVGRAQRVLGIALCGFNAAYNLAEATVSFQGAGFLCSLFGTLENVLFEL